MNTNVTHSLPLALKIVAVLFILGGVSAAIEVIASLMDNRIYFNFGVLGIFIGIGLLRLSQGWRTCALVFTWIGLIAIPIIGILFFAHSGPLDFSLFGQKVGHASKELGIGMVVVLFVYTVWQYRVLTREDVRFLFLNHSGDSISPNA